jgi:glycosyltransferase involved in cell wall biosynthesis
MMKILFIANSGQIGGGNKSLATIASSRQNKNIQLMIAVPSEGKFSILLKTLGIQFTIQATHLYLFPKWKIVIEFSKLLRLFLRYRPDIVHCNDIHCYKYFGIVAGIFKIPIICHMRHFVEADQIKSLIDRIPGYFLFNSRYNLEKTKKPLSLAGFGTVPTAVSYNYFYQNEYYQPQKRNNYRGRLCISENTTVMTLIGNINPLKGHMIFIKAIDIFLNVHNYNNILFIIAGEDVTNSGIEKECREKISNLCLEDKVMMVGFQSDSASVYAGSDIIVIPSEEEPFGRVAVEAILARKQVVAFNNSGLKEILEPLKTPVLCSAETPENLCKGMIEAVVRLTNNEKDLMTDQKVVSENFSEQKQLGKLVELYESLIGI